MGLFSSLFKKPNYAAMSKDELFALKDKKFYEAVITAKNKEYQNRLGELTDLQKAIFAVNEFDCIAFADVQEFFKSSAALAPCLADGLDRIGALKTKALVEKLTCDAELNGAPVTLNPFAVKEFEEAYDPFDDNAEKLDALLIAYVKKNFDEYYKF
ncbi:MAG: hypothetical protein IKC31_00265 [Clostridia bacterium]|nr:hypothetical protein [Clostridia bacterium]